MSTTPLREFATKVRANDRLGFGDLRRLQRDVLPNGPMSREDVEILVRIDATVRRLDAGWPGYLVAAVAGFARSSDSPAGGDGLDLSGWLNHDVLARASRRTAVLLARELARMLGAPGDAATDPTGPHRKRRVMLDNCIAGDARDASRLLCAVER